MAFSFGNALGHGISRVRQRPLAAARIWALDALLFAATVVSFHVVASAGGDGRVSFSLSGLPASLAFSAAILIIAVLVVHLCSEGAWARFLATEETVGSIPYRLGKDELRIFGTSIALGILVTLLLLLLALPFIIIGAGLSAGGVSLPVAVQLFPLILVVVFVFIAARIGAATMLAVRRKAFNPFDHFTATDPFWMRLGLASLVAGVLAFVLVSLVPGLLAGLAGLEPPTEWNLGLGIPNPWLEWLLAEEAVGPAHMLAFLLATMSSGIAALVSRGVVAHAAIHALEQHELDARNAYPSAA